MLAAARCGQMIYCRGRSVGESHAGGVSRTCPRCASNAIPLATHDPQPPSALRALRPPSRPPDRLPRGQRSLAGLLDGRSPLLFVFRLGPADRVVYFLSVNRNVLGELDAEPDFVTTDVDDDKRDVVSDHDGLV